MTLNDANPAVSAKLTLMTLAGGTSGTGGAGRHWRHQRWQRQPVAALAPAGSSFSGSSGMAALAALAAAVAVAAAAPAAAPVWHLICYCMTCRLASHLTQFLSLSQSFLSPFSRFSLVFSLVSLVALSTPLLSGMDAGYGVLCVVNGQIYLPSARVGMEKRGRHLIFLGCYTFAL
jgi:hypothetical protein